MLAHRQDFDADQSVICTIVGNDSWLDLFGRRDYRVEGKREDLGDLAMVADCERTAQAGSSPE
ncbi:hypothetical protein CKO23_23070 [Thiocystis violacea]|nr:hypothetical protein [Thiocystis violacea]